MHKLCLPQGKEALNEGKPDDEAKAEGRKARADAAKEFDGLNPLSCSKCFCT